jgi:hypothetical protein
LGAPSHERQTASDFRTFQHAHDTVAAGGEIDVLDPAGYGRVTITKSISIQGHGFAGIAVPASSFGITVNAGATDLINLTRLIIDGSRAGNNEGVKLTAGNSLNIQNSIIRGLQTGIDFTPSAASASSNLYVSDSVISDNSNFGILIFSTRSNVTLTAALNRLEVDDNVAKRLVLRNPMRPTIEPTFD